MTKIRLVTNLQANDRFRRLDNFVNSITRLPPTSSSSSEGNQIGKIGTNESGIFLEKWGVEIGSALDVDANLLPCPPIVFRQLNSESECEIVVSDRGDFKSELKRKAVLILHKLHQNILLFFPNLLKK